MNELLIKLLNGVKPDAIDLHDELREICEEEHASCNSSCPVYAINYNTVPGDELGCVTFKNGKAMMDFLIEHKSDEAQYEEVDNGVKALVKYYEENFARKSNV